MKTRHYTIRLLLLACIMLGLASCKDDEVTNKVIDNSEEAVDEPVSTDDQLTTMVTADLSTYLRAAFDEGTTGAALVNRLPAVTNEIVPETRFILLKGSDFDNGNTLTLDELMEFAHIYLSGGYIGLERPTLKQSGIFALILTGIIAEIIQQEYQQNFGIDSKTAAAAARQSQHIQRIEARMKHIEQIARQQEAMATRGITRADEADLDQVYAEMVILGTTAYFVQQPFEAESQTTVYAEDSEGNTTAPQTMSVSSTRTAAASGEMADAAATWLNQMEGQKQKAAAAPTRRAGSTAVNDIMSASESFTYSEKIDWRATLNKPLSDRNRVNMTVRCWSVHNLATNKDYYYLQQDVRIIMGMRNDIKIWWPISDEKWWVTTRYGDYDRWIGSFLSQYVTSMDLTGDGGNIRLEAALPSTDNQSTSTTVEIGSTSETTYTEGTTIGGGYGASFDGISAMLNFSENESWSYTNGTTFQIETSSYSNEWAVKRNTTGTKVTWTYTGVKPKMITRYDTKVKKYNNDHDQPAAILVNDCDMTHEICWSVSNPTGQYSFNITSQPQTAALLSSTKIEVGDKRASYYEYTTTEKSSYSQPLLEPNRASQTWRMFITIDEWQDNAVQGAQRELESSVRNGFPDIYTPQFKVAVRTAESLDAINLIVKYSKDKFTSNMSVLQSYAKNLGIKKFSISWKCDDTRIATKEPLVVELPAEPKPAEPKPVAQAVWCEGNTTLYFVNALSLKAGDKWDGQTVTKVWSGNSVTNSTPGVKQPWEDTVRNVATRVVFDKSFANVRPTSTSSWFNSMAVLKNVEGIENLNTSEVTTMRFMFDRCPSLTSVDVSGFDMSKVTSISYMFRSCTSLTTIYCGQTWTIPNGADTFSNCPNLKGAVSYNAGMRGGNMANPDTGYFTWPEGTVFVTLNEKGSNRNLLKRYEGQTVNVRYERTLTARVGDDGNYIPTPFTVCLPYDLDLSAAVTAGQIDIYTLAAVSSGQFVFAKLDITMLEAGKPYLVRVNKGSIALSANRVTISTATPKSSKVYSSLAAWRRGEGSEVGKWVGNFDYLSAADAADDHAYALRTSDYQWDYYLPTDNAWIPAFRCYLSSSTVEQTVYQSRFEE